MSPQRSTGLLVPHAVAELALTSVVTVDGPILRESQIFNLGLIRQLFSKKPVLLQMSAFTVLLQRFFVLQKESSPVSEVSRRQYEMEYDAVMNALGAKRGWGGHVTDREEH